MISFYKRNIIYTFLKNILIVSIVFFCLVLILNILEEITFFKDVKVNFILPLFLTLLNSPSILFEIFPFIFLIGTMSFFIEILDKNELIVYKTYGLSNFKIIVIITSTTLLIGIFLISIFYSISSNLKFTYFDIKNDYSKDDKYLAVVTSNGLWIKDQLDGKINIISAETMEGKNLNNVLINQFTDDFTFLRLIEVKKINIENKYWVIKDAFITENNLTNLNKEAIIFKTNFDYQRISTLFSNLSSLSILKLNKLKKDYLSLGYSTKIVDSHLFKIYSYPLYLSIMVCIASILMLNIQQNKTRIFYLMTGILVSVLIYYMNYLFNVLIENQKIPFTFTVWFPQFLLLLICSVGLVRINEK